MNWFKAFWNALAMRLPAGRQDFLHIQNLTPRAQKVLELAREEAGRLHHHFVGTEHLLLGLIRLGEGDSVAARVLRDLKVDIEQTRREILRELTPEWK